MTEKKKFIVYQTLDITIGHLVEAENMDEAMNSIWDNGIDFKNIVSIDADYAKPYEAVESEGETPMAQYEVIGFFDSIGPVIEV
ncbi:MAG: hypothetical protein ACO3CH_00075 [Ilumatobacteraceae bacterium]|nr:hypothetical protein [Chitinophagales bacterium]